MERVRGTPARAEDLARGLPQTLLNRRNGDGWSIQEHLGHLLDIEALLHGRLNDLENGLPRLRVWDGINRATWEADHNGKSLNEILGAFRASRTGFVVRLEELDDAMVERSGLHPRLNKPMRTIDLVLFMAEHDDHHLARISALKRNLF